LVWPGDRKVDKTLETKAPRQAGRFDPFNGLFRVRRAQSLWPQISVSRVAVLHQTSEQRRMVLRPRRRLEPESPPLVWPGHRKINETLETVAARQASFDRGLDDVGSEECE
jgi:hypothetical protein